MKIKQAPRDADEGKGATEDDGPHLDQHDITGQSSMSGQNAHRSNSDQALDDGDDTDFPEPGENPEHS